MRTKRIFLCAVALALAAQLLPAAPASAATTKDDSFGQLSGHAHTAQPCGSANVNSPDDVTSWSESVTCSHAVATTGSIAYDAELNFTETSAGGSLQLVKADGAAGASSSTVDAGGTTCCSSEGDSRYVLQATLSVDTHVVLSGSLAEVETPVAPGNSNPCARVRLFSPSQTFFGQDGAGGPLVGGSCSDVIGSSTFSYDGLLPAGPIQLEVRAFTGTYTDGPQGAGPDAQSTGAAFDLSLTFCTVAGTAGNDTLNGLDSADVICGLGGDDTISGGPGNDLLDGGGGADTMTGGGDDDTLYGKEGNDTLYGDEEALAVPGNDQIFGGPGDDKGLGGLGDDFLFGEDGNDALVGDGGSDFLGGGAGDDLLGFDAVLVEENNDSGIDEMFGGEGNDAAFGGPDDDKIEGGAGDDLLEGGGGNDDLFGQAGSDKLLGQDGKDCLVGGTRKDVMKGGPARDTILARDGVHDVAKGGPGNDRGRVDGVDQVVSLENQNYEGGCG